ncbi:MAG: type IV secretory system conjugative DNA transfer family protein [Sulfitobacter sp.]
MSDHTQRHGGRFIPLAVTSAGAWYAWDHFGPVFYGSAINPPSAIAAAVLAVCGITALSDALWSISKGFDGLAAKTPTGAKGTAAFITEIEDLEHELDPNDEGPYWGSIEGQGVVSDFASNALVIGTAGSGKTTGQVMPSILTIPGSKLITDMKSELTCVLTDALRARGEEFHFLNFGDVNAEILGPSGSYNPLNLIADNYVKGSLLDISSDLQEMALQLYPEPANDGNGDNKYFRDGSRDLLKFAMLISVLIDGPNATLGDVTALLDDREVLLNHALWACGRLETTPQDQES